MNIELWDNCKACLELKETYKIIQWRGTIERKSNTLKLVLLFGGVNDE